MYKNRKKLVIKLLMFEIEVLFHPESPGVYIEVNRTIFGRWFKPSNFATLSECVKYWDTKR